MKILKFKKDRRRASTVETSRGSALPVISSLGIPLGGYEEDMYDNLRESIPIIDAAIDKILRLVGGVEVKCKSSAAQKEMDTFFKSVKVGATGCGIESFVHQYLDRLLTWGTAVCEIVPTLDGRVGALYCADNKDLQLSNNNDPLNVKISVIRNGQAVPLRHPERVILTALNPLPGRVKGTSLLRGLPFVSSILLKIYESMGTNWERAGNLRYAVTYKPTGGVLESSFSSDAVEQISSEWSRAMNSSEDSGILCSRFSAFLFNMASLVS